MPHMLSQRRCRHRRRAEQVCQPETNVLTLSYAAKLTSRCHEGWSRTNLVLGFCLPDKVSDPVRISIFAARGVEIACTPFLIAINNIGVSSDLNVHTCPSCNLKYVCCSRSNKWLTCKGRWRRPRKQSVTTVAKGNNSYSSKHSCNSIYLLIHSFVYFHLKPFSNSMQFKVNSTNKVI